MCGLYSWRIPPPIWFERAGQSSPPRVIGAIACWGRMQVHNDGFRAEHACVVTLGYHEETSAQARAVLERIAARYRAELVPVGELVHAAQRHGSPLPDALRPAVLERGPEVTPVAVAARRRAPDVIRDELEATATAVSRHRERLLVQPVSLRARGRIRPRRRVGLWILECCVATAFVVLAVTAYRAQANASFVQQHGRPVRGRVQSIQTHTDCSGGFVWDPVTHRYESQSGS